jgi:hypothetical protein
VQGFYPNTQRIINVILKIINIVFSKGQLPPLPSFPLPHPAVYRLESTMLIFLSLIEVHKWAQLGNFKYIRDSLGHTAKEGGCGGGRLLENKISKMFLYNLCCTCLNGFNLTFASYFVRQTSHSVLWET